jgi:hypothetical protein
LPARPANLRFSPTFASKPPGRSRPTAANNTIQAPPTPQFLLRETLRVLRAFVVDSLFDVWQERHNQGKASIFFFEKKKQKTFMS